MEQQHAGSAGEAHGAGTGDAALVLPMPDDFHLHLRQGEAMARYVRREALSFGRALVMPNTLPPVTSGDSVSEYRGKILAALPPGSRFEPLMSFKLIPGMRGKEVIACAGQGAIAGKYYPAGTTTNAADGPRSPGEVSEALGAMEEAGIVLSIHGEDPGAPSLDREAAFLPQVEEIMRRWPRLRIVLEHLSTAVAVAFVASGPPRLAATLTAHHLLYTIDDMVGGAFNPHLFCKPILKAASDRRALQEAAFSRSPKFFFGSDSAPHPRERKESRAAPGGVYSAPTALPALAGLFEAEGSLAALADFISSFGSAFYRLSPPAGSIGLVRKTWVVPDEMDGIVPMCAGERLVWSFAP